MGEGPGGGVEGGQEGVQSEGATVSVGRSLNSFIHSSREALKV